MNYRDAGLGGLGGDGRGDLCPQLWRLLPDGLQLRFIGFKFHAHRAHVLGPVKREGLQRDQVALVGQLAGETDLGAGRGGDRLGAFLARRMQGEDLVLDGDAIVARLVLALLGGLPLQRQLVNQFHVVVFLSSCGFGISQCGKLSAAVQCRGQSGRISIFAPSSISSVVVLIVSSPLPGATHKWRFK